MWLEHAIKLEVRTGREVTDKFVIDITWETKVVKVTLVADISLCIRNSRGKELTNEALKMYHCVNFLLYLLRI